MSQISLLLTHIWVGPVERSSEGLFHGSHGNPSIEVCDASGFVVRTRLTASAKWLLIYNGSGRLVVDIKVAGRLFQAVGYLVQGVTVARPDRSGQRIR